MRRTASQVIRSLEERVARLERQAKTTNFSTFINALAGKMEVPVYMIEMRFAFDFAIDHPRNLYFRGAGASHESIRKCTFSYDKIVVVGPNTVVVDVDITNPLGETLKDKIEGSLDSNGRGTFRSLKYSASSRMAAPDPRFAANALALHRYRT